MLSCTLPVVQAPPPERLTARRWGVHTTAASAATAARVAAKKKQEERDPALPTTVVLPSCIEQITNKQVAALFATGSHLDADLLCWLEMDGEVAPEPLSSGGA